MSQFSEVQTTEKGRRYFVLYDEKYGDKAYVQESSMRVMLSIGDILRDLLNGYDFKKCDLRMARPFKNGKIRYIRNIGEEYEPSMFGVLEIEADKAVDHLILARKVAERLDQK